jgi:hypothetical protein
MRDILIRIRDLGLVSRPASKEALRIFTARGWRIDEPGEPYPAELPRKFESLVLQAMSEEMISMSRAAELMSLPVGLFQERLGLQGKP